MTNEEAIAIIRNEYLCVNKDCDIERSCGTCDLAMPSKEPILEAYKMAIEALEQQPCRDSVSREAVKSVADCKSLDIAIKSLEAWEKIKGELKRQIDHNLEVKEKFLVGSYTRMECQITCTVLADVINMIDKHLSELEDKAQI